MLLIISLVAMVPAAESHNNVRIRAEDLHEFQAAIFAPLVKRLPHVLGHLLLPHFRRPVRQTAVYSDQ